MGAIFFGRRTGIPMTTTRAERLSLGKYREIVLAVACFLVFDLAVLVLNFYISYQISQDALAINLAGRQRMLSQRMTKALLTAEADTARGLPDAEALAELNKTVALFDSTLAGFVHGGTVTGGDGQPATLALVDSAAGREILTQANAVWGPYKELLLPFAAGAPSDAALLGAAVEYARANNLALLGLMNDLTTHLEQTANAKADALRKVQSGGILLALLNFGFILFKFLGRLRDNDRKIEAAQKETAEILGTVKEGLFLLGADFRIGSQFSASLPEMLGRAVSAGTDFRALLRAMVAPAVCEAACDYIELLFGQRVRESLVLGLNPLTSIEVAVPGEGGSSSKRYLTLQFNRVSVEGKISHLLVTVFDVTAQVELERTLAEVKKRAHSEIEVMLDLLKVHPASLRHFLESAERKLLEVNDHLRNIRGGDYRRSIIAIFRLIHALKGEAAVLGLELFEQLAQQFETVLAELRDKGSVSGEDLVALPLPLDEFLQRIATARDLMTRLASYHDAFAPPEGDHAFVDNLSTLARRIAADHGKEIQLVTELDLIKSLPRKFQNELREIGVQLLRNAVMHGIEAPSERAERAKPATGNIYVTLKPVGAGEYEFVLRDDGRGLIAHNIRAALLRSGRYSEAQLNEFDERQILMKIFEAGVSTVAEPGRDAGHGVGMDVVKHKLEQLGARLRIATRENMFTQFSIRFAV
jgi:HPt (histidine-containing phosphotransfer) domain-containing protein